MFDISAISNVPAQLLYAYRILSVLPESMSAILPNPVAYAIEDWIEFNTEAGIRFKSEIGPAVQDKIPFLEFLPADQQRGDLAYLEGADIIDGKLYLISSKPVLLNTILNVYWAITLHDIQLQIEALRSATHTLDQTIQTLTQNIENVSDTTATVNPPKGLVPNLLQISESQLVDSGYKIQTPEAKRLFVNYSQIEVNQLLRIFNTSVEFRFTHPTRIVLEDFSGPVLRISGSGTLILRHIRGQVLVNNWTGKIAVIDCPDVHIQAESANSVCILEQLRISRNSNVYLENYTHYIKTVTLLLGSTLRHWRGFIQQINWIGVGCTYWCADVVWVPGINYFNMDDHTQNTVYDFDTSHVLGTFIRDKGDMIIHAGTFVHYKVGNVDSPTNLLELDSQWEAIYR